MTYKIRFYIEFILYKFTGVITNIIHKIKIYYHLMKTNCDSIFNVIRGFVNKNNKYLQLTVLSNHSNYGHRETISNIFMDTM